MEITELLSELSARFGESPETIAREGLSLSARSYYDDVRGLAAELVAGCHDGEIADLDTTLHEAVSDSQRVIRTRQAMLCVVHSDNGGIGPKDMGADSFDWSNGIPWSALAYHAFRADVQAHLPEALFNSFPSTA